MKRAAPLESGMIRRAYRVRLEPTAEQRRELARCVGVARAAFNWALAEWRRQYRAYKLAEKAPARALRLLARWQSPLAEDPRWQGGDNPKPNGFAIHKRLTAIKREQFPWMTDVPALVVREAVGDVGAAYEHFFRRLKEGAVGREAGEPRFRSRHRRKSFHMDQGDAIKIARFVRADETTGRHADAIVLPVLGSVHVHKRQNGFLPAGAKLCGVGISEHLGLWYAAVRAEVPAPAPRRKRMAEKRLGVEVGVRSLAVTSDGKRIGALRDLDKTKSGERRLALWLRRMSRRFRQGAKKQSAGWVEAKHHVQRLHSEIAETRDELLHYASRRVVDSGAAVVVMREPNVRGMIGKAGKTGEAARARNVIAPMVSKVGWYELRRKVEYKQQWAGGAFVEAPAEIESTKTCSVCGSVRDTDPGYPLFRCPSCGHQEDREANSSKVLRDYRPPSGGPVGGDRADRRKTARKRGTMAERTGKPGGEQSAPAGPDGVATSPHGSGNGAASQEAETGAVIRDPTRPPGEPGARLRVPSATASDGGHEPIDSQESCVFASPPDGPDGDRSQTASQASETSGGSA